MYRCSCKHIIFTDVSPKWFYWKWVNPGSKIARYLLATVLTLKMIADVIFNTLRRRQNGHHFPDDIFKWIFLNENVWISINTSLMFAPRCPIKNIQTFQHSNIQVMAWRRPGNKPLSEPMMVRLPTHTCVTRSQWFNNLCHNKMLDTRPHRTLTFGR